MNGAQKTIKALALVLAVVIMVSLLSAVLGAGMILNRVFSPNSQGVTERSETVIGEGRKISELNVVLKSTSLRIERGEDFQVVVDEEIVEVRRDDEGVYIEEKEHDWWGWWNEVGREVKIVLPEGEDLKRMTLEMGAGTVYAKRVVAEEVELNLGAGRAEFDDLRVTRQAKVAGGAGLLIIKDADLRGLDLEMGVGKTEVVAGLRGDNRIKAGVGKLDFTLVGENDDYRVKFDPGLGAMSYEGVSLDNPEGKNLVEIDGGVGAIDIRLMRQEGMV